MSLSAMKMCSLNGRHLLLLVLVTVLGTMPIVAVASDEKFNNDVTGSRIAATTTAALASSSAVPTAAVGRTVAAARSLDLDAAATSGKLFNLGSLFGYPNYGYGNSGGSGYRPVYNQYPGYYPNTGSGYYPNSGSGYYPNTGSGYYPNSGSGYYPSSGGGYYPNTPGSTYYPTSGGSYYTTNNLGGFGGYGGYGGNGGLRQYTGYLNSAYSGHRNRGYGYYTDTDSNGLPLGQRNDLSYDSSRDRDRAYGGYRGYN